MLSEGEDVRSWDGLRPELAPGVTVDPPLTDGAPWVISVDAVPRARVGDDFARVARLLDGRRSLREAVRSAGVAASVTQALTVVNTLAAASLLRSNAAHGAGDGHRDGRIREAVRRFSSRFRYRPPLTVQYTLFDSSSLARSLTRLFRLRGSVAVCAVAASSVIVLGGLSAAIEFDSIEGVLADPLPVGLVPGILLAVLLTGCLHELSHAVTLAAMGARPSRMGIMLLYLMPAFFCDVTDGWRIGERWRRAAVALAGPALHLILAAASFATLLVVDGPGPRAFLVLYGSACAVAVVANLIPFLKLDGYLVLVALTDTPYLRANAVAAARRASSRLLFGGRERRDAPRRSAALVVFGALCVLFPILLFAWAAIRLQPIFVGMGPWMALTYLALVASFLLVSARRIGRFFASGLRRRVGVGRALAGSSAALVAVAIVLLAPVRVTVHAGFMTHGDDVLLVSSTRVGLEPVRPGDRVILSANGVVLRPEIGRAVVGGGGGNDVDVSLAAVAPVTAPRATMPGWGVRLRDVHSSVPLPPAGAAEVDTGDAPPLGALLVDLLVLEPVRAALDGGNT
ncbi:MAG: hypothetical protein K0R99_1985 [Microbacterium sp.]|jgi:putative peptide zinc metalloprotease protein|uniref:daptide biosynthesis intramembrane metalloprotease n=1 Tax=Microbacterium sp. TaxID=51671 RepID=UPI00260AB85D|nr:daptide biosynthesis intramembrane metalloprotease [Microbacterium sp.]MDF2560539.1 hypothetical protein [Microbacterium sp.]